MTRPVRPDHTHASCYRAQWNGTLVRSRVFDALSLLLPAGETFMIASIETWREQTKRALSPRLIAEVDRFVREEKAHRRAHERYNETLIADQPHAANVASRASRVTDDLAGLDLTMRLALVAAFEHLTALLSHEIVEHRSLLVHDDSPESRMWRWHAAEELGHCEVAMEATAQCRVSRARLTLALVLATGFLMYDVVRFTFALCRCDIANGASRLAIAADMCHFVIGSLPSLTRMARGWWRYILTPSVDLR
nr:metal-dependent hydrolase [Burkholderia lata]